MGVDHQLCERCGARGVNGSLREFTVNITDINRVLEFCEECPDIFTRMFINTAAHTEEEIDEMEDEFFSEDNERSIKLTLMLAEFLKAEDEAALYKAKQNLKAIKAKLPALKKKNMRDRRRESLRKWVEAREAKAAERQKKIDEHRAEKLKATAPVAVVA
jgi:hypothetical protein